MLLSAFVGYPLSAEWPFLSLFGCRLTADG